jgi:hypothetical protein
MAIRDLIGLDGITLPEAIALLSFVIIPMVIAGMFNPAMLGYTFSSFAGLAYLMAVYTSIRRQDQYDP